MTDTADTADVAEVERVPATVDERRAARRRAGRPSVLSERVIDRYGAAILAGATKAEAAEVVGIHHSTVRVWAGRIAAIYGDVDTAIERTYDEDPEEDGHDPPIATLIEFFAHASRMEAAAITDRLNDIRRAQKDGNWTAAAWWLERRFPDRFGRRTRVDHGGVSDEPVRVRITFDGVEDRAEPIDVEAIEADDR